MKSSHFERLVKRLELIKAELADFEQGMAQQEEEPPQQQP